MNSVQLRVRDVDDVDNPEGEENASDDCKDKIRDSQLSFVSIDIDA